MPVVGALEGDCEDVGAVGFSVGVVVASTGVGARVAVACGVGGGVVGAGVGSNGSSPARYCTA